MNDVDQLLQNLSATARAELPPPMDVRARVLASLSIRSRRDPLDIAPIAFAGAALTIAAAALLMVLPSWQTLTEPWSAYLP